MLLIFNYGDIQNISLTPDKEPNIVYIERLPICHHIQELQTFNGSFFGPPRTYWPEYFNAKYMLHDQVVIDNQPSLSFKQNHC